MNAKMADFNAELSGRLVKGDITDTSSDAVHSPQSKTRSSTGMPIMCAAVMNCLNWYPFTRLIDLIKISSLGPPSAVEKAIDWLVKNKLLTIEKHRVAGTRPASYAVIPEAVLRNFKLSPPPGRGSFQHRLYQDVCRQWFEAQSYKVQVEGQMTKNGKSVDVLAWSKERGYVAVEVSLHLVNLVENIRHDLAEGASEICVVTVDKAQQEQAVDIVANAVPPLAGALESITFRTIDHFSKPLAATTS